MNSISSMNRLVKDIIGKKLYAISPDSSVSDAVNLMISKGIHRLPVIKDGSFICFIELNSKKKN